MLAASRIGLIYLVTGPNLAHRYVLLTSFETSGSACASGSLEPSHVLVAMGLSTERARAGLRGSFGRTSTKEDAHFAVDTLRKTRQSAT